MTNPTIAIPNLGIGNFASVIRMVEKVGGSARLVDEPSEIAAADKIVLAGVGAFDKGMSSLNSRGWADALREAVVHRRKPILGICLGMQLMCEESEEGTATGLGWISAKVKRFVPPVPAVKVPHMGWNTVTVTRPGGLISADGEQRFYFVHSYFVECGDRADVVATARHGQTFDAAFSRANIHGVQFHPEKSHRFGMSVMRSFIALEC